MDVLKVYTAPDPQSIEDKVSVCLEGHPGWKLKKAVVMLHLTPDGWRYIASVIYETP